MVDLLILFSSQLISELKCFPSLVVDPDDTTTEPTTNGQEKEFEDVITWLEN